MSEEKRAEALLSSANDTAKLVRSVHLTFMLVMAYVGIIIASTTDVQLLKISPVTLPLLNVKLPILEFYVITPWLLLFLHFNLLLQCYLLARKLHLFNDALAKCEEEAAKGMSDRLFTFALSYNIVGRQNSSFIRFFQNGMMVFSIVIVPLVLLTWAQIRFIPYHSEAITWSHRAVILIDCMLLWIVWPMIVLPEAKLKQWLVQNKRKFRTLFGKAASSAKSNHISSLRGTGQTSLMISSVCLLFISWVVAVHPDHNDKGEKVEQFFLTEFLFNLPGQPFRQDLYMKDKILVKGDPSVKIEVALMSQEKISALKEVVGLSLQERDLRFATFEKCIMPKSNLINASLQGAVFRDSFLHGSDFLSAKMQGVNMLRSHMHKVNMMDADLRSGQFVYSDLNGSVMRDARMQDAVFTFAKMSMSDMEGGKLQRATLISAVLTDSRLNYANLKDSQLQSANMLNADLTGANIEGAIFSGTNISGAKIDKHMIEDIKARNKSPTKGSLN